MTLVIRNGDNQEIQPDGTVLPLECGGQGLLMFPIYPSFGGFEPPNGDGLLFRWQPRLPLLRSVECLGMGRAEEREDEPAPRGMWAKLRWWLGW